MEYKRLKNGDFVIIKEHKGSGSDAIGKIFRVNFHPNLEINHKEDLEKWHSNKLDSYFVDSTNRYYSNYLRSDLELITNLNNDEFLNCIEQIILDSYYCIKINNLEERNKLCSLINFYSGENQLNIQNQITETLLLNPYLIRTEGNRTPNSFGFYSNDKNRKVIEFSDIINLVNKKIYG